MKISLNTSIHYSKILITLSVVLFCSCNRRVATDDTPSVYDENLELTLFGKDPDIVTPVGIAIDRLNRIFVLESHTHQRPQDYSGPEGDVVKMFVDDDNDGQPEKISVFAEGFKEGLTLAFSPEGILYLLTSKQVIALYDRDEDGKCDEKKVVVNLEKPDQVYAHAALLSVTFSHDNWMYVSRGNTSGEGWKLVGSDGTSLTGYGDGGNIVRSRPDGSELEEVATGFWNPADIKFDSRGRLFAADNDPDSRGPNRLVHVVEGGDYGYKSLYGGSGIHPYLAWNGELPHTLPFAVGLGEAPSGLLNANHAALPEDYKGEMLCTIWEESRIVRIRLSPKGVSVEGESKVIVEGNQEFRPVCFAADDRGNIFFTDWVLRDYVNHGKGKIWRMRSKAGVKTLEPQKMYDRPQSDPGYDSLEKVFARDASEDYDFLKAMLGSEDPFLRHAASVALARPLFRERLLTASTDPDPAIRLGVLVALFRSSSDPDSEIVARYLGDEDESVRQMALIVAGVRGIENVKPSLASVFSGGNISDPLFETYLATVRHLQPAFIDAYRNQVKKSSKSIERVLPPSFIEDFVKDPSHPPELRAVALRYLERPQEQTNLLISFLAPDQHPSLRLEAVRSLSFLATNDIASHLLKIVQDDANSAFLRAEALLALGRQPTSLSNEIISLLDDDQSEVRIEAARYLRAKASADEWQNAMSDEVANPAEEDAFFQQVALGSAERDLTIEKPERPANVDEWQKALSGTGDAERGRRVFFSTQGLCSSCHAIQGRGGDLGPDLTNAGLSKSREQLIQSILKPSEEISPEWQGWFIELRDSTRYQGRQIDVGGNSIELYTEATGFINIPRKDIASFGMIRNSLMPDGLEARLTVQDLRDLLAFLEDTNKR